MPAGTQAHIAVPSRYRIVRHVANGGMASVWVAEDELLGRRVAVKVLGAAYAAEDRAHRRFLREARAGARLGDCRHVVTVYDLGEHGGSAFMVMEYFAGGTVADRLARGMSIPRALALRWLREAGAGLDCAHEHDVVHRDVKPANLMLDQRGRLAVGDFGIATVATEASVTQTGQVLGTAAYISPEQARGRQATDASDRYALAVVAYELLTGSRPFPGEHPAAQARAHVEAAVPYASDVHDGLPPAVDRVLQAGMAKDPRRRPASAADLVDGLEDALDGGDEEERFSRATAVTAPVPRRPPTTGRSAPVATGAPRHRLPAVVAALALVFVTAAAIAIAMGTGGRAGSGSPSATSAAKEPARTARRTTTSSSKTSTQRRTTTASGTTAAPTTTQPTTATGQATTATTTAAQSPAALNNQAFALLRRGQAAAALPLLQRSVAGFRAAGATGSLDYAYALYNLADALRLSGRPAEAVPLLEERLRVSANQRGVVERELARARAQAGGAPAGQAKPKGNGKARGNSKSKGKDRDRGDG
jgi:eukaryotic-like serine/threonine-protein kinase